MKGGRKEIPFQEMEKEYNHLVLYNSSNKYDFKDTEFQLEESASRYSFSFPSLSQAEPTLLLKAKCFTI